jgi:iron(III) transport system ATP-binding protein
MAEIRLEALRHAYVPHPTRPEDFALKEIDLAWQDGGAYALLGPSGCGKTTLLRMLAGFEKPTEGRIIVNGKDVTDLQPYERKEVNMMFQSYALFPHMTVERNIGFGLRQDGMPAADIDKRVEEAMDMLELKKFGKRKPHQLSGGQQQRVALARAIVPRPQVMLMDEPFSGLDQRLRDNVRAETLTLLKETRATALLVTHDPVEALGLADRILLMRRGRLIQAGTPTDIYRRPADAEAARFFCDMNELTGRVRSGQAETPVGTFAAPGRADGDAVLVMVRPQAFSAAASGIGPEGFVLAERFIGDATLLSVIFKGLEEPLAIRMPAGAAPRQGTSFAFSIDPAQVLVFTADGSTPI